MLLDVFKDEFLKSCDKQHPRASRRGVVALDEHDLDDAQCEEESNRYVSDDEEDHREPFTDAEGLYVCIEDAFDESDNDLDTRMKNCTQATSIFKRLGK